MLRQQRPYRLCEPYGLRPVVVAVNLDKRSTVTIRHGRDVEHVSLAWPVADRLDSCRFRQQHWVRSQVLEHAGQVRVIIEPHELRHLRIDRGDQQAHLSTFGPRGEAYEWCDLMAGRRVVLHVGGSQVRVRLRVPTERDWPNLRADVQPVIRSELAARLVLRSKQLRATELLSARSALGEEIGQAMLHRVVHKLSYAVCAEPTVQHLLQSQASPARSRKLHLNATANLLSLHCCVSLSEGRGHGEPGGVPPRLAQCRCRPRDPGWSIDAVLRYGDPGGQGWRSGVGGWLEP